MYIWRHNVRTWLKLSRLWRRYVFALYLDASKRWTYAAHSVSENVCDLVASSVKLEEPNETINRNQQ